MIGKRQLEQLEQRVGELRESSHSCRSDETRAATKELIAAWEAGGCQGPFPPPVPRPLKYSEADWDQTHRRLCGLVLRRNGLALPADFSAAERVEIDANFAHFEAVDPGGTIDLVLQR